MDQEKHQLQEIDEYHISLLTFEKAFHKLRRNLHMDKVLIQIRNKINKDKPQIQLKTLKKMK